ncbi:MAG: hypothetical protein ACRC7N_02260 [Clostridium sp.]
MDQCCGTNMLSKEEIKKQKLTYETKIDKIEILEPESVVLRVTHKDCVIRRDVKVNINKYQRVYGIVSYKCDGPAKGVLISLVKYDKVCGVLERNVVGYCVTDAIGSFSFLVQRDEELSNYKVEICNVMS